MAKQPKTNGEKMDKDPKTGKFVVGNNASPGRPKGSRHMSTLLEEAIKKVANDTGTREDVAIVRKVIELARDGDMKAIEHIWDRLEGKAPQEIKIGDDGATEELKGELKELSDKFNEFLKQSS